MSALGPCPACHRHVRVGEPACPFCGADAASVAPGAVRPLISRRQLTRAAVFAGAALLASACGDPVTYDEERSSGGEDESFAHDRDSGGGRGISDEELRALDQRRTQEENAMSAEEQQRAEEEQRRQLELEQQDPRRHRRLPQCYYDGTCPAPPYGTPPAPDALV